MTNALRFALVAALVLAVSLSCVRVDDPGGEGASANDEQAKSPVVEYVLEPGDSLYPVLTAAGISPREVALLVEGTKEAFDLRRITAGKRILYQADPQGALNYFRYDIDDESYLQADRSAEGFEALVIQVEYEMDREIKSLELTECLYCDAEREGWDYNILDQVAARIFAWDIDFHTDIRVGDRFTVLVERKFLDGVFKKYGSVLASLAWVDGRMHLACYYEDPDGVADYYDLDGRSLRKQFLRSPLQYSRISSGYTYRRMHPILKIVRPHLGIDYAAPSGTPIWALGDGKVTFAGRKGGFGKYVVVRHNSVYTTTYGHLRGYAKGIRRGAKVKQGQTLGYVGATGLATGPHLDFRMKKNGSYVNPLRIKFPDVKPLKKEYLPAFQQFALSVLKPMGLPETQVATTEEPPVEEGKEGG